MVEEDGLIGRLFSVPTEIQIPAYVKHVPQLWVKALLSRKSSTVDLSGDPDSQEPPSSPARAAETFRPTFRLRVYSTRLNLLIMLIITVIISAHKTENAAFSRVESELRYEQVCVFENPSVRL